MNAFTTLTDNTENTPTTGISSYSGARWLLLAEGLGIFAAAVIAYAARGSNGWLFALLLLAPDLAMLGYLGGTKLGALTYNLAHTLIVPGALLGVGLAAGQAWLVDVSLIWIAHIGMDRSVGYGFKYATSFKDTHMGRV